MSEMSPYPPSATPNAPPPGLNPGYMPNPAESGAPVMYQPTAGYPGAGYPPAGYPPTSGYPPGGDGYPPTSGYPPGGDGYPPTSGYPPGGDGYPPGSGYPPSSYPPSMDSYSVPGGYPPGAPMTNQPVPGAGYPPPTSYPPPGMQPPNADGNWMPAPVGVPVCPAGLEYLTTIDQLIVHQKVELLEAFLSFETKNKYSIKNSLGQKIYTAKEDTDCCTRNCLGTLRPFDMKIKDNSGNEIIHLYRPLRCVSCCCPCCLQVMEVMSPPGNVIGSVVQDWSICYPKFRIQNATGETVLRIEGPLCTFAMCGDVEFKVLSVDGKTEVGCIRKQWSGLIREALTDADHFGITFPLDLDVNMKAVLLGACMLIDFMFFEKEVSHHHSARGRRRRRRRR